ncbi:hypothetical protein P886_4522 [Alteromonadaceae bacterium 2753L.S.0a.02]|nr:hypothetical protein P886_4522 [Alteromonadaceae bacterium 2753L.S.0a.02]
MRRYYYVSEDLNAVEQAENDLLAAGITEPQIHVLSQQDAEVEKRHLHEVNPFAKLDVLHSGLRGALIGLLLAAGVLLTGWVFNAESSLDWLPFVFLAIAVFGFATWEGGFYGIQVSSEEYKRFALVLERGCHVLMVDATPQQKQVIDKILAYHAALEPAGEGAARPEWVIASQRNFHSFVKAMP